MSGAAAGEPAPNSGTRGYDVTFGPDIAGDVAAEKYVLMEVLRCPDVLDHVTRSDEATRAHYDGTRLVLPLARDDTEDGTFSAVEVSSSPCIDQDTLDALLAQGSPRCVLPGREAVFRDFVTSPHFADGRAADQTTNVGVNFQSWRGFDRPGVRPAFVAAAITYVGGRGLAPAMFSRSWSKRRFMAVVTDANSGLVWAQPLEGFDCSEPHDLVLRWLPDRDIEFLVDGRLAGRCESGRISISPLKLRKKFRTGVDWFGHRHITVDPCSITAFTDCSSITPDFEVGRKLDHDLWTALSGMAIHPLL